jgi:glycosyltransferase 2 family protein
MALRAEEHSGDLVRLGLALGLFVLTLLAIQRDRLSDLERDVFRLINDLPPWLMVPMQVVEQVGSRFSPLVIGVLVMLVLRRYRLGLSIIVAGMGTWFVAQGLKFLFERPRPAEFLPDLPREWTSGGPGFVSGHTAVATAVVAVTAPYLPRPWRRVAWSLVVLVGFARIYSGVHLPLDVVGGFAVGWFIGTLVHMLVGVPRPRRTPEAVTDMLRRLGLTLTAVEPVDVYAEVSHPFRATTDTGTRLFVKVLDPDPRSTDWVLRIGRVFASRERRDVSALASLPAAADHEAAVMMAARNAGVRVPPVVLARGYGSAAVLVLEDVPGRDLTAVPSDALADEVLHELWRQVARLHRARVAHHDLVRANVLLDEEGRPWLVDFREAEVGASDEDLAGDVAELMASLAVVVGPQRAVGSARAALGPGAVEQALPALQVYALSPRTRREMRDRPGLLDAVRAEAGGGPEATAGLLNVHRIWAPALLAFAGYAVLVTVVGWGNVLDALTPTAELTAWLRVRWALTVAAVFAVAPLLLGYAILLAARCRVAVGRSAAAAAVSGAVEVIGGPAARRYYLERYVRSNGARGVEPRRTVDLLVAGELAAGLLVLVTAAVSGWLSESFEVTSTVTTGWFAAIAAVAVAASWVARRTLLRGWPAFSRTATVSGAIDVARRRPARAAGVLAAVTGAEIALVVAMAVAFRVMGPAVDLHVVALALAATHVALMLFKLSGLPVVGEATCVALLTALGVEPVTAVVGVLLYALVHYWVTALVAAVAAPRLAPVHEAVTAGRQAV